MLPQRPKLSALSMFYTPHSHCRVEALYPCCTYNDTSKLAPSSSCFKIFPYSSLWSSSTIQMLSFTMNVPVVSQILGKSTNQITPPGILTQRHYFLTLEMMEPAWTKDSPWLIFQNYFFLKCSFLTELMFFTSLCNPPIICREHLTKNKKNNNQPTMATCFILL